jgi:hypothetical protein
MPLTPGTRLGSYVIETPDCAGLHERLRPARGERVRVRSASEEPSAAAERARATRLALGVGPQRHQKKWGPASPEESEHPSPCR